MIEQSVRTALARISDLKARLEARLTSAESDITAAEGRLTTAESDITAAEARLTTLEGVKIQHGVHTQTSDSNSRVTVTFPSAFATAPTVVATRASTTTNQIVAQVYSVSTTEVVFTVTSNDALQASVSNISVHWIAIGT